MVYFLGIDVGTSSIKTGLWHVDGHLAAHATHPFQTQRPAPTWVEQDPMDWWLALKLSVQDVLQKSQVNKREIAGIGIDSTGWTFVPVDKAGQPLRTALIWQDRRAKSEAETMRALSQADDLVALCANPLDEGYATPKLQWLRTHQPEIYDATDQFLMSSSFLVRKLTGINSCDYSQANTFHFFDIEKKVWDESAADVLGIDLDKMPPLYGSCDVVGELTRAAADELELLPGVPVIAGGLDAAVGAFGSGITHAGTTADQGGTAFGLSIAVDKKIVEPRLIFSAHVVPGLYLLQGGTVGGGTFEWFRKELGHAEQHIADQSGLDVFSAMTAAADQSIPGANGLIFLPYMSGERSPIWDSDARGVFMGLSYESKRQDIVRAMMEGCVFAVYHNMQIALDAGATITEWIGIGGAANSASWCQLKADITDRPFTVAKRQDGKPGDNTLGLAVMAGYGTGHYSNLVDTMDQFLPLRDCYDPDPHRHEIYEALFPIYLDAYQQLKSTFVKLAEFSQRHI